jgi:hypothetical protein
VVSARRPDARLLERLLHPAEHAFDASAAVRAIVVHYPARATPILGLDVPWWLTFFIVSIVAALLAKPWIKVQF